MNSIDIKNHIDYYESTFGNQIYAFSASKAVLAGLSNCIFIKYFVEDILIGFFRLIGLSAQIRKRGRKMSYVKEPFEELDVMNFFMFNKLTTVPETAVPFCKCTIRNLLGKEVEKIIVRAEKMEFPDNPAKRGVRLDVQVEELGDGEQIASIYDIEPHRDVEKAYPKKNRFQQAQIDKNNLSSGVNDFMKLPEIYIICITNYDPFGYDQMLYTIKNHCQEEPELEYNDGVHVMYFNTKGTKGGSEALKRFLTYLEDSKDCNATDEATQEIKDYVGLIKHNQEIGGRYMTVGDLMDKIEADAHEEGREEGKILGLVRIVKKKVDKKQDLNTIADAIEEDVEYIRPIYDVIVANPKMDESEVVKILQKKKII